MRRREHARIGRRLRDHHPVCLDCLRKVSLVAEGLRYTAHECELIRYATARGEVAARRIRPTNLRERDRHVLDRFAAQSKPRLLFGRKLVVCIDQTAEHVHGLLILGLVCLICLIVVGPTELVERKEVDVARWLRLAHCLLVRLCRRAEPGSARLAALT